MRNYLFFVCFGIVLFVFGQISFFDFIIYFDNVGLFLGMFMAVVDMNGDGLQDFVIFDNCQEFYIEYQQVNILFFSGFYVQFLNNFFNGIVVGDVDGNGYNDILIGGFYNVLWLFLVNDDGIDYMALVIDFGNYFLQGINMVDMDNDGDFDFFVVYQDGFSVFFCNFGNNVFFLDYNLINFILSVFLDNLGNYGIVWMDYNNDGVFDFYIFKYCFGVIDVSDGWCFNLFFCNDDDDDFIEVVVFVGLFLMGQSIFIVFGDIDNDGDYDVFVINYDIFNVFYCNNGNGIFINIISNSNILEVLVGMGLGVQVIFIDFDNDGCLDLFYMFIGVSYVILCNQGNFIFVRVNNVIFIFGRIYSVVVGDFNVDGFVDIYVGYGLGFN